MVEWEREKLEHLEREKVENLKREAPHVLDGPHGKLALDDDGFLTLLKNKWLVPNRKNEKGQWYFKWSTDQEKVVWEHELKRKRTTIEDMKETGWVVVASGEYPKAQKWKKWYHIHRPSEVT